MRICALALFLVTLAVVVIFVINRSIATEGEKENEGYIEKAFMEAFEELFKKSLDKAFEVPDPSFAVEGEKENEIPLKEIYQEEIEKHLPLRKGGILRLDTSWGNIELSSWEKDEVLIQAKKEVKAETKEEAEAFGKAIQIVIESKPEQVEIHTFWPEREIFVNWPKTGVKTLILKGYPLLSFHVDYTLKVPKGVSVQIEQKWGNVNVYSLDGSLTLRKSWGNTEIQGLSGDLQVESAWGNVNLQNQSGSLQVKNAWGRIKGELPPDFAGREVELENAWGGITLSLPEAFGAKIRAQTGRGKVYSDFPLEVNKHWASAQGTIGDGRVNITLKNSWGDINLLRSEVR